MSSGGGRRQPGALHQRTWREAGRCGLFDAADLGNAVKWCHSQNIPHKILKP
ncbi:hypothetical protein LP419_40995 [Massilia sp. H-1]|nr:hypothetical protein LP419_40995 [Massilia sp. H-1]